MGEMYIKIGADGGDVTIINSYINGIAVYHFRCSEYFTLSSTATFVTLTDAWQYLKYKCPKWYQLYLVQINTQMTELVKKEYIKVHDKNEYTINSWLVQLTGRGIGF